MKIAICGDSFIDRYCYGEVNRLSPEAPVPVLDAKRWEDKGGGAINVANNLFNLGLQLDLFTITNLNLPYPVISPSNCTPLLKTRFVSEDGSSYQLLRVDEPKVYLEKDLKRMKYPSFKDYDLIAFIDYDKGLVKGGEATLVDSKKKDLSCFKGSEILKINMKEWNEAENKEIFPKAFITQGKHGMIYFEEGNPMLEVPVEVKSVSDVTGAGDTVTAVILYCLANKITDPNTIMIKANKAAAKVISRFGTAVADKKDL
jgi:D-beta-D-heptose 7-phosphate kinase/D-beta-D-heptose 1-phosphate adenosyltransferase